MVKGKRVLLTGATGGIGRELAQLLNQDGAEVVLIGRNRQKLDSLLTELRSALPGESRAHALVADFRDLSSLDNLVERTSELLGGPINALVNNAGVAFHCPVEGIDKEELLEVFQVNALAPILLASKAFEVMKHGGGHIINVTSVLGQRAMTNTGSYTASKHALSGFSKVLRKEGAAFGIAVAQIEFGAVETNFLDQTHDVATVELLKKRRLRRIDAKVAAEWILHALNTDAAVCSEVITVVPTEQLI